MQRMPNFPPSDESMKSREIAADDAQQPAAGVEQSDLELVRRAQRNERGAFDLLVLRYQHKVIKLVARRLREQTEAEDVAQEAFVKAYRALASYPAERIRGLALRPWLYRITLNTARNRFRGKKLRTVSLDHPIAPGSDATWEAPDSPEKRPDRRYEKRRERQDIAGVMAALPERYRAALQLRYVEGLRLEEVATVLGQPLGTVKSNVHRGINALREALSESRREGVRS